MTLRKYLFVDRDGTLIEEPPDQQVDSLAKLRLMPGVIESLQRLSRAGYRLIMVTNQDGLGSDTFPQADFDAPHEAMLEIFASQGITFDDILICPHLPEEGCLCRKPHLGLVRPYLTESLDRQRSCVVGDRDSDIALAANLGLPGYRLSNQGADDHSWAAITDTILNIRRAASLTRATSETEIYVQLDLDGRGRIEVETGIGFLDHMITQLASHGGFDLTLRAKGDLEVDPHHTVEDVAIALGQALRQALGDKFGIRRYGFLLPMDEALAEAALDLSGRPMLQFDAPLDTPAIGTLPASLVPHFFRSFTDNLGATLHLKGKGDDAHHIVEGLFKATGRALRDACQTVRGGLPSTKGTL